MEDKQTKELKRIDLSTVKNDDRLNVVLYIRTSKVYDNWLKENNIKPTKLFNECIKIILENRK